MTVFQYFGLLFWILIAPRLSGRMAWVLATICLVAQWAAHLTGKS